MQFSIVFFFALQRIFFSHGKEFRRERERERGKNSKPETEREAKYIAKFNGCREQQMRGADRERSRGRAR